ncbi:MAG: hypothetical protein U0235_08675 [Polyangiaceae bacterium]
MNKTNAADALDLVSLSEADLAAVTGGAYGDPNDPNGLAEFLERYFREQRNQMDSIGIPGIF